MSYAQPRQYSALQGQGVPDGVLVGQAQAGDQRAFEFLVSRYHRPLANYVRGFLKDGEQVYDVLQQVYLQLYVSLPILLTNVSLKGWLFQVARNRCLDELRRRRRRAETSFSTLAWEYSEMDLYCTLQEATASLPPKVRSIVRLRCFKQLTFSEIGRMLNMPQTTVKTYFYRSLPRLRRALAGSTHLAAVS